MAAKIGESFKDKDGNISSRELTGFFAFLAFMVSGFGQQFWGFEANENFIYTLGTIIIVAMGGYTLEKKSNGKNE